MEKVLKYIEDHREEYIELLRTFCRQPSVSTTGEGIPEMVELVKEKLGMLGGEVTQFDTEHNPILYCYVKGDSERTWGSYDHYDVQPVDPIDAWHSDPFGAEIRDGAIYARGTVDNKNGLAGKIAAVDAWQKVYGAAPCNVKFFVEGEEEIGSPSLAPFAETHRDLLQCDGFHWESGWKDPGCYPQVEFGEKGLLYVELRVKTADTDLHSCNAGIVPNPAWRLVWALSTLKGPDDRILIDGFYDDILPLDPADISILEQDTFDEELFRRSGGFERYVGGLSGKELLMKHYYEPTCNIAGLVSGYTGEGSKTILPNTALVKMDFRLVPGQDPEKIARLLREHLDRNGFEDVEIVIMSAMEAYRSDPNSLYAKAVTQAMKEVFGGAIIHHTLPGTSPMGVFCKADDIPVASFGGTSTGAPLHAPNEFIYVDSFIDEIKMYAAVMKKMAEL